MQLLTLKLALSFIAATIALAAHESNSCSAQNTKNSPTAEEIDGNAIESLELVEGESKKLNYQQPIPIVYLGVRRENWRQHNHYKTSRPKTPKLDGQHHARYDSSPQNSLER